jgi:ABC-type nitrate/sulfonate/bicarbonate transport system permease component
MQKRSGLSVRRTTAFQGVLAFAIVVGVWSLSTAIGPFQSEFFPSLIRIGQAAWHDWPNLADATRSSLAAATVGYVLGFGTAVVAGMVIGRYPRADAWLSGAVDFFRSIPAVAIIPLTLLLLRTVYRTEVFAVAWGCFFLAVINIIAGAHHVPQVLEDAVRAFGGREHQILRKVAIPFLLPFFLATLRQNVAVALIVVVVADMFLGVSGLGFYILNSQATIKYDQMYAAVFLISLIGFATFKLLEFLERRLFPWSLTPEYTKGW